MGMCFKIIESVSNASLQPFLRHQTVPRKVALVEMGQLKITG